MGIVFGVTGSKEPSFALLKTGAYEIRLIQPYIVAEIANTPDDKMNESFRILAKYIGVFGTPENKLASPMAMTAPVIQTQPKRLAMTAPVINMSSPVSGTHAMQFVLPFEYVRIDQVPQPTDSRVLLRSVPERIIAVTKFSGWYDRSTGIRKLRELHSMLKKDKMLLQVNEVESQDRDDEDFAGKLPWSVAQYHPPFTIPFLRRNEIWFELPSEPKAQSSELQKILQSHQANNQEQQ